MALSSVCKNVFDPVRYKIMANFPLNGVPRLGGKERKACWERGKEGELRTYVGGGGGGRRPVREREEEEGEMAC